MQRFLFVLTLVVPFAAQAQMPEGMDHAEMMRRFQDPAAMQKMAEQAEAAERCMAGIQQSEIDALERKAQAASREIERLCAAGKRDEALAKGLALSREMQSNATIKKIRECTKDMSETMRQMMPMSTMPGVGDDEPTDDDICS